jgi:hypothetical protein
MNELMLLAIASLIASFDFIIYIPIICPRICRTRVPLSFLVPVTARTYQARPIYNSLTDYCQQPDPGRLSVYHRARPKQRNTLIWLYIRLGHTQSHRLQALFGLA